MMEIVVRERPEQGKRQRSCNACGAPYEGWNFVHCGCAEKPYRVVEAYRGTSYEVLS